MAMEMTLGNSPAQALALALEYGSIRVGDAADAIWDFLTASEDVIHEGGVNWRHRHHRWTAWFDEGPDGVQKLYARELEVNEIIIKLLLEKDLEAIADHDEERA